jgi:endonuclease YncB( thermonuclease family)
LDILYKITVSAGTLPTSLPGALVFGCLFIFGCSAHAEVSEGKVVRVVDGDSLIVLVGRERIRVRLKEIDAPELKQPFGKESQQALSALCANTFAHVAWAEKDRNGRTLGRVWCGGVDANAEQVRQGMAWVFDRYVKDRQLYSLQDAARSARLGLWSDVRPVPPWEWRTTKGAVEYRGPKLP